MRVYAFGARAPFEGAELVQQQLWLATIYQRALTLLERKRRDLVELLYRRKCPIEWAAYSIATEVCTAAAQAMRLTRVTGGDMLEPDQEMQAETRIIAKLTKEKLEAARQKEIETRQAWKDARKKATPKLRRRLKMIDNGVKVRQKFAYNAAGSVGLAWGTRLKVGESVERAAEMSAKAGSMPHLPRYDGTGAIVVQLQGASGIDDKNGLAAKDAHSGRDTRFRLEFVDAATWHMMQGRSAHVGRNGKPLPQPVAGSKRSQRREAGHYAIARLRVGSDGRTPVWAAWPVIVHRQIPENAPIKWAQVHAKRIGARIEWQLQVTIDDVLPSVKTEGGTVAVNLGWRTLPDGGLRVGYSVGTDDKREEIRVPPAYVAGVAHVDSLRSIRDRLFETAKKTLVEWAEEGERPEWFDEELRYVDRWRAQRRLVMFLSKWRNKRFAGDRVMFDNFTAWQKKDRHLWFWECDEREKLLRMRRDVYRNVAARLAKDYARVLVTDMDLRDFAEAPAPEDGARSDGKVQRVSQRLAAPSELRGAIKNACSTRGTKFEEVDAKFKTQTCNSCGVVFAFAAKQDIEHACECGARWDQDANHCLNLLASGKVVREGRGSLAPSVSGKNEKLDEKKGRWQKRRSKTDQQVVESALKTG